MSRPIVSAVVAQEWLTYMWAGNMHVYLLDDSYVFDADADPPVLPTEYIAYETLTNLTVTGRVCSADPLYVSAPVADKFLWQMLFVREDLPYPPPYDIVPLFLLQNPADAPAFYITGEPFYISWQDTGVFSL